MNWKRLAQECTLAELIDRLNQWATDADRRQAATFNPRSSSSASSQMALNRSFQVDSTRVSGLVTGSTGSSSLAPAGAAGSLQFKDGTSLDGEAELTWQGAGNLLGVTGDVHITGGVTTGSLSTGSLSATSGMSLAGGLTVSGGVVLIGGVSADSLILSGLTVTGAANFMAGLSSGAGVSITGTLRATGAVSFSSTLYAGGQAIFNTTPIPATSSVGFGTGVKKWSTGHFDDLNGTTITAIGVTAVSIFGCSLTIGDVSTTDSAVINALLTVNDHIIGGTITSNSALGCTGQLLVAGGATLSGGATFNGQVGMLAGLTVTGGLTSSGQIGGLAGMTLAGGLTSSGLITGLAGLSISGATVVIQPGGTNQILIGTSCIRPITTGLCDLGKAAQRFANINGQTGNFNSTFTAGSTCLLGAAGRTSTLTGDWTGSGSLTMAAFIPVTSLNPQTDIAINLGLADPNNSSYLRWFAVGAAKYFGATVGIVASGTTITVTTSSGNYFELTGTSTVAGITQSNLQPDTGGTQLIIGLSSNSKLAHGTQFDLQGDVQFSGQTGDHIGLIGSGGDKWREFFRWRASGQLFQPVGTNKPSGWATLIGGVTTVPNTLVGSSTIIHLTPQNASGTLGSVYISSRTVGASFDISSTSALDTRLVAYTLIEPEGL